VDHGIWETNKQDNLEIIQLVHSLFNKSFNGIPFYPIIGNHETHPVNVIAPLEMNVSEFAIEWLYDDIAKAYAQWLPSDTLETIKKGAYYTVLVKPGFRIIALNNNDCYTYNWWILTKRGRDAMTEQLQWFHDTLLAAEQAGEKVHVLIHIPSGDGSCYQIWSREYRRIIDRFHDTISAQFNGHTHRQEYHIFYARSNSSLAINVAWNGGSITPYSYVNILSIWFHFNFKFQLVLLL
jgi:sphingomyelin phosphodiesterase